MHARSLRKATALALATLAVIGVTAAPAHARVLAEPEQRSLHVLEAGSSGLVTVNKTVNHPIDLTQVPRAGAGVAPQTVFFGSGSYRFYTSFEPDAPSPWATYGTGWGSTNYRRADLAYSAYCAQAVTAAPGPYPPNLESWIVAGPIDMTQCSTAWLRAYLWLKTEIYQDALFLAVSVDGENWDGILYSGDSYGWHEAQIDLADYIGQPRVWLAFAFASGPYGTDEGAYVDGVTITVNNPPVTTPDNYATGRNTPKTVPAPGVLANDRDPNGDPMIMISVTQPANGTVSHASNGAFTYTPNAGFEGTDTFTYCARDGVLSSSPTVVTMTVGNAPVANADLYRTEIDQQVVVSAAEGVLKNDSDADGDALTALKLTDPAHGAVAFNADGSFTYTPAPGYEGLDSFTYQNSDGTLNSASTMVTLVVGNVAPVAGNDTYATTRGVPKTVPAPGVLGNDTDLNADTLTVEQLTDPAHGTLTMNADGSFVYTPVAQFTGTDTFTYRARDSHGVYSGTATVTINVTVQLSPVYRFYNLSNGTHFFTPSAEEADAVIRKWPTIFQYEGPAYFTNPANNSQPLFRFYNKNNGSHFYTASPEEANSILVKWPTIFSYDGQTYAVNPAPIANSIPVYRFYNKNNGSHFYTASAEERDTVIARWPAIYQYEGPAFWLGQ